MNAVNAGQPVGRMGHMDQTVPWFWWMTHHCSLRGILQGFRDGAIQAGAVSSHGSAPLAALAALASHLRRIKASSELAASSAVVPYEVPYTLSRTRCLSPRHPSHIQALSPDACTWDATAGFNEGIGTALPTILSSIAFVHVAPACMCNLCHTRHVVT